MIEQEIEQELIAKLGDLKYLTFPGLG